MVIILNRITYIRATVLIGPRLLDQSRLPWKKKKEKKKNAVLSCDGSSMWKDLYNFSYLMTPCSEKRYFVRVGIAGQTA